MWTILTQNTYTKLKSNFTKTQILGPEKVSQIMYHVSQFHLLVDTLLSLYSLTNTLVSHYLNHLFYQNLSIDSL